MPFNYKITNAWPAYGSDYELQVLPWRGSNGQHFNLTRIKALKSMSRASINFPMNDVSTFYSLILCKGITPNRSNRFIRLDVPENNQLKKPMSMLQKHRKGHTIGNCQIKLYRTALSYKYTRQDV
ncbi:hypothetical protein HKD37_03G006235 [Glycine soja]